MYNTIKISFVWMLLSNLFFLNIKKNLLSVYLVDKNLKKLLGETSCIYTSDLTRPNEVSDLQDIT